jgi:hypothetical protein
MGSKGGDTGKDGYAGQGNDKADADYYARYPSVKAEGWDAYTHYLTFGKKAGWTYGVPADPGPSMDFSMPDFSSMYQQNDYSAVYAQQQADAEKKQGELRVQDLFHNKLDAADKATSDVNNQIAAEMAHAKTVGLDYTIDDKGKQERINNAFANYWSAGDESDLTGYIAKYGNAGTKWDLPIERGISDEDKKKEKTPGLKAGEALAAGLPKTAGQAGTTDQDPLGSNTQRLGG